MPCKPLGDRPMTNAERQARHRAARAAAQPVIQYRRAADRRSRRRTVRQTHSRSHKMGRQLGEPSRTERRSAGPLCFRPCSLGSASGAPLAGTDPSTIPERQSP